MTPKRPSAPAKTHPKSPSTPARRRQTRRESDIAGSEGSPTRRRSPEAAPPKRPSWLAQRSRPRRPKHESEEDRTDQYAECSGRCVLDHQIWIEHGFPDDLDRPERAGVLPNGKLTVSLTGSQKWLRKMLLSAGSTRLPVSIQRARSGGSAVIRGAERSVAEPAPDSPARPAATQPSARSARGDGVQFERRTAARHEANCERKPPYVVARVRRSDSTTATHSAKAASAIKRSSSAVSACQRRWGVTATATAASGPSAP